MEVLETTSVVIVRTFLPRPSKTATQSCPLPTLSPFVTLMSLSKSSHVIFFVHFLPLVERRLELAVHDSRSRLEQQVGAAVFRPGL